METTKFLNLLEVALGEKPGGYSSELAAFKKFVENPESNSLNEKILDILQEAYNELLKSEEKLTPGEVEWLEVFLDNLREEPTKDMIEWVLGKTFEIMPGIESRIVV